MKIISDTAMDLEIQLHGLQWFADAQQDGSGVVLQNFCDQIKATLNILHGEIEKWRKQSGQKVPREAFRSEEAYQDYERRINQ